MNPRKHLRSFYEKAVLDKKLTPSQLSIYMALFQLWSDNQYRNPIRIERTEIMKLSRIKALATYHKCLKYLNEAGYIKYHPSFHPYKGSQVLIMNLTKKKSIQIG